MRLFGHFQLVEATVKSTAASIATELHICQICLTVYISVIQDNRNDYQNSLKSVAFCCVVELGMRNIYIYQVYISTEILDNQITYFRIIRFIYP